jgi:hypothetical protein
VEEIRRSVGNTRNSGWKILDRNWEIQTDPAQIKGGLRKILEGNRDIWEKYRKIRDGRQRVNCTAGYMRHTRTCRRDRANSKKIQRK